MSDSTGLSDRRTLRKFFAETTALFALAFFIDGLRSPIQSSFPFVVTMLFGFVLSLLVGAFLALICTAIFALMLRTGVIRWVARVLAPATARIASLIRRRFRKP